MQRERITPRPDWQTRCEDAGFDFHSIDGGYWDESACYRFTAAEIDVLSAATETLHELCLEACETIVAQRRLADLAIPASHHDLVMTSWRAREPGLCGRFDLAWSGEGAPKMLEYNADTANALLETGVVQAQWKEDVRAGNEQFNSLHDRLIDQWPRLRLPPDTVWFACGMNRQEDLGNLNYLRETATQAGYTTRQIFIEDLCVDPVTNGLIDVKRQPIATLWKLYPWEHFSAAHIDKLSGCRIIEPAWKLMLSGKGILAILWELFPNHANLLPAYREAGRITGDCVRKPLFSRAGGNITLSRSGETLASPGPYGAEGYVYQAYAPIPCTDGNYAVIGSWIVGGAASGICVREDLSPITHTTDRFVPHYVV